MFYSSDIIKTDSETSMIRTTSTQSVNTVCILRDLTVFYQGIIRVSFNNFTKINMIEYFNTACLFERFKVVLSWKCQGQSYEYQGTLLPP